MSEPRKPERGPPRSRHRESAASRRRCKSRRASRRRCGSRAGSPRVGDRAGDRRHDPVRARDQLAVDRVQRDYRALRRQIPGSVVIAGVNPVTSIDTPAAAVGRAPPPPPAVPSPRQARGGSNSRESSQCSRSYACARESASLLVADRLAAAGLAEAGIEEVDALGRTVLLAHVLEARHQAGKLLPRLLARVAVSGGVGLGGG